MHSQFVQALRCAGVWHVCAIELKVLEYVVGTGGNAADAWVPRAQHVKAVHLQGSHQYDVQEGKKPQNTCSLVCLSRRE
jgi:hypothetical protein